MWYQARFLLLSQFDPQNWQPSMNREKLKLSQLLYSTIHCFFIFFSSCKKSQFYEVLLLLVLLDFLASPSWQHISWRGFMPMASLLPFNFKLFIHWILSEADYLINEKIGKNHEKKIQEKITGKNSKRKKKFRKKYQKKIFFF